MIFFKMSICCGVSDSPDESTESSESHTESVQLDTIPEEESGAANQQHRSPSTGFDVGPGVESLSFCRPIASWLDKLRSSGKWYDSLSSTVKVNCGTGYVAISLPGDRDDNGVSL